METKYSVAEVCRANGTCHPLDPGKITQYICPIPCLVQCFKKKKNYIIYIYIYIKYYHLEKKLTKEVTWLTRKEFHFPRGFQSEMESWSCGPGLGPNTLGLGLRQNHSLYCSFTFIGLVMVLIHWFWVSRGWVLVWVWSWFGSREFWAWFPFSDGTQAYECFNDALFLQWPKMKHAFRKTPRR